MILFVLCKFLCVRANFFTSRRGLSCSVCHSLTPQPPISTRSDVISLQSHSTHFSFLFVVAYTCCVWVFTCVFCCCLCRILCGCLTISSCGRGALALFCWPLTKMSCLVSCCPLGSFLRRPSGLCRSILAILLLSGCVSASSLTSWALPLASLMTQLVALSPLFIRPVCCWILFDR